MGEIRLTARAYRWLTEDDVRLSHCYSVVCSSMQCGLVLMLWRQCIMENSTIFSRSLLVHVLQNMVIWFCWKWQTKFLRPVKAFIGLTWKLI